MCVRTVIGVMGGAVASDAVLADAARIGELVADHGWVLLTGGRDAGIMAAASRAASALGGLVVGILPGDTLQGASPHLDIAIPTGMGDARNAINVLASSVVVALPGGAGTISEVALALKSGKRVVTVGFPLGEAFGPYYSRGLLVDAQDPDAAVALVARFLKEESR